MERALIRLEEARARVLDTARPLRVEPVPLERGWGRVLAEDVVSDQDLPPFDSSAMDGYAVAPGTAAELAVVGESRAGHPAEGRLRTGEAMVISTGARIPDGADAVVPVERAEARNGTVGVPATAAGAHVRRSGEDVRAGELLMRAGGRVGPAECGVLASLGYAEVPCVARPKVALVVTGDELVGPAESLGPGQIRDSNLYSLSAQAAAAGAEVVGREVAPDDPSATRDALDRALARADVVCVSGGVSVGPHDHVKPALADLGVEEIFWGVALKPGKPTWFGRRGPALVFGLPGNPVSAMVTFHLFARPALRRLEGAAPEPRASATVDAAVARDPGRDRALSCRLEEREDGWHVEPRTRQGSHVLTSMLGAGALALVPAGWGSIEAGERVEFERLA